ncbi:MAG: hypothetical protein LBS19_16040 [Clostridiales bacterium]|nr:hypothetical protein [Clostridiales bacterium]
MDAEALWIEQSVVSEGMSEAYLRFLGIQATRDLAESDNAKLVIIGDKDGLPLLLNPDSLTESETLPSGITADEYIRLGEEGARLEDFTATYDAMMERIGMMNEVLGEMESRFPKADESIGELGIQQESNVLIKPEGD